MLPTLFCPQCQTYLGSRLERCSLCAWERPASERLLAAGEPLWRAAPGLPSAAFTRPVVTADLVIYGWGRGHDEGGLIALDRRTGALCWRFDAHSPPRSGVTLREGRLYFGTLAFLDGALFCLNLEGELLWKSDLPGGAGSVPVAWEARLFIGGSDGRLACFDQRTGAPLPLGAALAPLDGNLWLVMAGNTLVALSRKGQIAAIDPLWLRPLWVRPLEVDGEITAPPCVVGDAVFFGLRDGRLGRLDLRARRWEVFAKGMEMVRAPLVSTGDLLLVGGRDHHLRAFNRCTGLQIWQSEAFAHSIVTSPAVADGLVVTAVNGGEVACLDLATGEVIWRYVLAVERGLMSDPLLVDGIVYAASDGGEIVALPWHLGRYSWAGAWLEEQGDLQNAGACFAIAAADALSQQRVDHWQRAIRAWMHGKHPEWAAYFQEADITAPADQVARAYQQAGENLAQQKPSLAADLLLSACDWYEETDDDESAQHCMRMASRLTRGPHIHIREVLVPRVWQANQYFPTIVELKNHGRKPARQVWVRFSGSLKARVWMQFEYLLPGQRVEVEIPLAAHEPGSLVVDVRYQDNRGVEQSNRKQFEIQEVRPFEGVLIEGSIGALSLGELPSRMIIRGDVGLLKQKKAEPVKGSTSTNQDFQ